MSDGTPVVPGSFAPGSRVAGYLLEEQIGQGGMAVVFRAHDERLDRTVALKILAPALAADEAFRQRFIRESRAAAAVDDPHIIPVFEAGEASGVLFIAMRFVRGGDVRSLVGQGGPLSPGRAAEIVSQVASALDAAHGRGLVHRDVKPANMLLDSNLGLGRPDHVYLSDFGLSKGSLQTSGLTGTGTFLGTLDYISPEQIEGKPVDGRADEYALACAAYELLSGVPPFQRDEAMAVMYAQLSEPAPTLTSRRPDLPPVADAVFAKALAKAPAERYQSCREFADALREAFGFRPYDSGPGTVPTGVHAMTQAVWKPHPGTEQAGAGYRAGGGAGPTVAGAAATGDGLAGSGGPIAGQAARFAGGSHSTTSPDLTAAHLREGHGGYLGRQRRPWWRAPATLIAAVLVLLIGGGGAYLALKGNHTTNDNGATSLKPPGPSSATAHATRLTGVAGNPVPVQNGRPFGVSAVGKFVFVNTNTTIDVFSTEPGGALMYRWPVTITSPSDPATGTALTHNDKYLLVAAGNGIEVTSVAALEADAPAETSLMVPNVTGYGRAVQVAVSPDDRYAFVSLQYRQQVAVFNLGNAAKTGDFSAASYVGSVNVGLDPVGLTAAGNWLFATNFGNSCAGPGGQSQGHLSVLSLPMLEHHPSPKAIKAQVQAGCSPARILVPPNGSTVWVTARQSNYLLGYSMSKLLGSTPNKALVSKIQVGQNPIGIALAKGDTRIVIANNAQNTAGASPQSTLSVLNASAAASGKSSALLGYIQSGGNPRQIAVSPNGKYLYVTDGGTSQIQVIDVGKLP